MSAAARTIASFNLKNLHILACRRSNVYALNPYNSSQISTFTSRHGIWANQGVSLYIYRGIHSQSNKKMNLNVNCNVQPSAPIPPRFPSISWIKWIMGALLSMVLPFWKSTWPSVQELEREVDMIVDTIDTATEVIEEVAEGVEKAADEMLDKLPEGGKLKDVARSIEHIAKNVADDAHAADELIHKVEKVEKEVETVIDAVLGPENEGRKEVVE